MLRRPPTTLTLTPTDIAAYEVSRAKSLAQAAAEAHRKKQKLREKQRQEQVSPLRDGQNGTSRPRPAGAPVKSGVGRHDGNKGASRQAESHGQRQAQAQAQRIFGREAGSVGPSINDDDEDGEDDGDDDDDLDVTLPTERDGVMRGGSVGGSLFRDNTALPQQTRGDLNISTLASDTETATETDDDDIGDVPMDTGQHDRIFDRRRDDDEGDGPRGGSSSLTIQSRAGPSQSRGTRGDDQTSTSNTHSTSSTSGRNANTRARQATPQIQSPTSQPGANSHTQDGEVNLSLPPSDAASDELPASKTESASISSAPTQPTAITGRKPEDTTLDPRNKRRGIARLPRRQWA